MAHDHNNNGHKENKPVAFTTPLICGLVAVFVILAFTSLGNPCHHKEKCCTGKECSKECMEKCEKGDHKECKEEGHEAEAKHEEHAAESTAAETPAVADSTKHEEPAKEEAKHEEAHH